MAEKITITEKDILAAKTYIPIVEKEQWVQKVTGGCIDRVSTVVQEGDLKLPMPAIFSDNMTRKSRYLMGAFVKMYLGISYEPTGDDWLMSADDYDRFAGSHIFGQLERLKTKTDARDRIFDMLSDFRDLEKRLNTEIFNTLQIQNDVCARLFAMFFAQTTPETLQKGLAELGRLKGEIKAFKPKFGGDGNG